MLIRVLHIIKSLGRGGAEMLLPETLQAHDRTRFEFHYIYFLPWKNQLVEDIEKNGGKVTCVAAANNLSIILRSHAVKKYIRHHDIQIVHCHLPWAGFVGRILHKWIGIPVLYTEHNKQERYHAATRWLNRLTFNWQSGCMAVSKDVAASITNGIDVRIPVRVLVNGVNTAFFQRDARSGKALRSQLGIQEDAFVVGTIAVFRFQKRLKEWLEVFATVSAKNAKLYGMVVGDGPLKNELVEQVSALGLGDRIFMPGLQTEVKPWFSAMDAFMMSSIFEGLPIALLEAMSMECAVLATDAGGTGEVIHHNENGLLVPVNEWQKLEIMLTRLIEQPELRKKLAVNARVQVTQSFGMERLVNALEGYYTETVTGGTDSQP